MRKLLILSLSMALLVAGVGCANSGSPAAPAGAVTYTCPMHREVVSNSPGKCPKCGMDLVAKQ